MSLGISLFRNDREVFLVTPVGSVDVETGQDSERFEIDATSPASESNVGCNSEARDSGGDAIELQVLMMKKMIGDSEIAVFQLNEIYDCYGMNDNRGKGIHLPSTQR